MGEGKKIVTEHFPVERLPEELRAGIEAGRAVRVTVEVEEPRPRRTPQSFFGSAPGVYGSPEEAVAAIRKLRDEWDG